MAESLETIEETFKPGPLNHDSQQVGAVLLRRHLCPTSSDLQGAECPVPEEQQGGVSPPEEEER